MIFSDIEVILKYNMVFSDALEKRVGSAFDPQTVKMGDIFIMIVR